MTKLALYLASLLLEANFSPAPMTTTAVPIVTQQVVNLSMGEQRIVNLVNAERWKRNLGTLSINPILVETARLHSREMADMNYFDHISPTIGAETPMKRYLSELGYRPSWAKLGENLYYCSIVDPNRGHKTLMGSKLHKQNILDADYDEVGVGIYISPDGRFWVTELFLTQVE